jgi:predicted metalloprotease
VIAHEVGHHVQNLLGVSSKIQNAQRGKSQIEANQLSVKLELQADCLAGIWAHYAQNDKIKLEVGDLEEAINAAAAVGDDRLQEQASGAVRPERFTHGTSEQRMEWFKRGYASGTVNDCNTFK